MTLQDQLAIEAECSTRRACVLYWI